MSSPDAGRMHAWYTKNGRLVEEMVLANRQLNRATAEWEKTRADVLRDRTTTAARDLLDAVQALRAALPVGVQPIDEPLGEALSLLRQGAEILTALPLGLEEAALRVQESGPILQAGYDAIGRATEAARRTAGA